MIHVHFSNAAQQYSLSGSLVVASSLVAAKYRRNLRPTSGVTSFNNCVRLLCQIFTIVDLHIVITIATRFKMVPQGMPCVMLGSYI